MTARLSPDPARIKILAQSIQDFHQDVLDGERLSPFHKLRRLIGKNFRAHYFIGAPTWRVRLRGLRYKKRAIPDFAAIGAVRSGTSTLSQYILQHPCVVLPLVKEPLLVIPTLRYLLSVFPLKSELAKIRERYGVAITGYCAPVIPNISWPLAIKSVNPEIKVILILRDPVERVFSHWKWDDKLFSRWKSDPLWKHRPDFDEAMRLEVESLRNGGFGLFTVSGSRAGYLTDSIYLPFIRVLFQTIGRERVQILNASEFFADPAAAAAKVYRFLELPDYLPQLVTENNAGPRGALRDDTRKILQDFFEPHNRRLYEFLGQDFGWTGTEKQTH